MEKEQGIMLIAGKPEVDDEEMEEMLESYLTAKKIENDPQKFAMLKEYAMSRTKMVQDLFKSDRGPKAEVKSFADMKKKKAELDKMEQEGEED